MSDELPNLPIDWPSCQNIIDTLPSSFTNTSGSAYKSQAYRYPISAGQGVVRIPVAGPAPFNTLVVVRGWVAGAGGPADDVLRGVRFKIETDFVLARFDQRKPHRYQHSTTAVLQLIQADGDTSFVAAINKVGGCFDKRGTWVIMVDVAGQFDGVNASTGGYYSSWVLCHEPPL